MRDARSKLHLFLPFAPFLILFSFATSAHAAPKETGTLPIPNCASLLYPHAEWIAMVEKDPLLLAHAKWLQDVLLDFRLSGTKPNEASTTLEVLTLLSDLRDRKLLRPVLAKVVHDARKHPKFPKLPLDDASLSEQLHTLIDAELYAHGFSPLGAKATFKPWQKLAPEQLAAIEASGKSKIGDASFLEELSSLTKARFRAGASVRLLNDASESLAERLRLIRNAKKTIWIATWALYDDRAGEIFAKELIARHQEGVDVRLIVDGQVAQRSGYRNAVLKLRDAGIPVIEWRSKMNPYYGQHRKFLVVDPETGSGEAIAGGRNLGDAYLHTGEAGTPKWRDTDILYQGPVVADNAVLFRKLWNEQSPKELSIPESRVKTKQVNSQNGVRMGIIDHSPNPAGYDRIYLANLKAIDSAESTIDIANAYLILTPGYQEMIRRARLKGRRVRILTNSAESIDEPIITTPILKSLAVLHGYGCEIWVKKGDTLHSKVNIFDRKLTTVDSYNQHPRSLRYEGEIANVIYDEAFARKATEAFEQDLAVAKPVTSISDLGLPPAEQQGNALSKVFEIFIDQF